MNAHDRPSRHRSATGAVAVHVLTSAALSAAWPALDELKGPEYRRILVPVFRPGPAGDRVLHAVANVYAAAGTDTSDRAER